MTLNPLDPELDPASEGSSGCCGRTRPNVRCLVRAAPRRCLASRGSLAFRLCASDFSRSRADPAKIPRRSGADHPTLTLLLRLQAIILYLGAHVAAWTETGARGTGACDTQVREADWLWQTHAYVIWPIAAHRLLACLPVDMPVIAQAEHCCTQRSSGAPLLSRGSLGGIGWQRSRQQ